MMKIFGVILILVAAGLTGCSTLSCGDPHPYLNSQASPPLKAPAGLSVPAPDPAYAISGVAAHSGKRTDLSTTGACLINPPQVVLPANGGGTSRTGASKVPAVEPAINTKTREPTQPASAGTTAAPSAGTVSRLVQLKAFQ